MKLVETDALARDIEHGLGQTHWLFDRIDPDLRLRMSGACGVASLAIAKHLQDLGRKPELVLSSPRLSIDPYMRHVFIIDQDTIIDPAYSQFLGYAGLSPGYVMYGGVNYFPLPKIESFTFDQVPTIADRLTLISRYVLANLDEKIESLMYTRPELEGIGDSDMKAIFSEIWNPDYFDSYEPDDYTLKSAAEIADFIIPEHVKLVA